MNQSPSVYIPTLPDGNGIILPVILSLLVHGLLVALLLFVYQIPKLDLPDSIETTVVTPEQLAEIRGQILANRAAAANAQNTADSSNTDNSTENIDADTAAVMAQIEHSLNRPAPQPTTTQNTQTNQASTSQRVPVFVRTDKSANTPIQLDKDSEKNSEYERKMAAIAAQIEQEALDKLEAQAKAEEEQRKQEQKKLQTFKEKENNPTKVEKPKAVQRDNTDDRPSSPIVNLSLGEDGSSPIVDNIDSMTNAATGSASIARSTSGKSVGDYKNDIVAKIQSRFQAPIGSQNKFTILSLRLDANGRVLSATANGSDDAVNAAAVNAAYAASPLPIDSSNPQAYASINVRIKGR